jgi:streptogrisin C
MKGIFGVVAVVLAAAVAPLAAAPAHATSAAPAHATSAAPYLADADDPAVTTLARDAGISIDEARGRIGWQDPATAMADELRPSLGEGFGGLWFDVADRGRVKIGVVGSAPVTAVRSAISRWGLTAVADTVQVRHSLAQLERDSAWLASLVAAANVDGGPELSFATQVDRNRLVLRTPADRLVTPAQRAAVDAARVRLGARLVLETWSGAIEREACVWHDARFSCDAPMRGGVKTYISINIPACSTGFNARSNSDGKWYVLTAGHCGAIGTEVRAYQPTTGAYHVIGSVHNRVDDDFDDFAIVRINNVPGWAPRNWVYVHGSADTVINPDYTITGVSTSLVGTRVCLSGANSGTDCGDVVELDWNGPSGFARAEYCSESGDSGGPVYSNHKARGIHIGFVTGQNDCFHRLFQGVTEAADIMNVHVVTS